MVGKRNIYSSIVDTDVFFKVAGFFLVITAMFLVSYLAWNNPNFGGDSTRFLLPWQSLLAGKGYTVGGEIELLWSPGYGMIAVLPYLLLGDIEFAGMLVSATSYVLLSFMVLVFTKKYFGNLSGILASFYVVSCPVLLFYAHIVLSELVFTLFFTASYMLLYDLVKRGKKWPYYVLYGCVTAISCLIRPDSVIVLLLVCIYLFVANVISTRRDSVKFSVILVYSVSRILLVSFSFFIVMLPYMMFLYIYSGNFTVSNKIGLVLIGGAEVATEWTLESAVDPLKYLVSNFLDTIILVKSNFVFFLLEVFANVFYITVPFFGILILLFLFARKELFDAMGKLRSKNDLSLITLCYMAPLGPCLLYDVGERYVLPYIVIMIPVTAAIVSFMIHTIFAKIRFPKWILLAFIFLWPAVISSLVVPYWFNHFHWNIPMVMKYQHGHLGLRAAGLWYHNQGIEQPKSVIGADKSNVFLFYAVGKGDYTGKAYSFEGIGITHVSQLPDGMDENNIEFVVVDKFYGATNNVGKELWNGSISASDLGLKLVHSTNQYQLYRRYLPLPSKTL